MENQFIDTHIPTEIWMGHNLLDFHPHFKLIPGAWIRNINLVRSAGHDHVVRRGVVSEAVGGGDDDDGVAAQEDGAAAEPGHVRLEQGALPRELVLRGVHSAQNTGVVLPATSGGILHPMMV